MTEPKVRKRLGIRSTAWALILAAILCAVVVFAAGWVKDISGAPALVRHLAGIVDEASSRLATLSGVLSLLTFALQLTVIREVQVIQEKTPIDDTQLRAMQTVLDQTQHQAAQAQEVFQSVLAEAEQSFQAKHAAAVAERDAAQHALTAERSTKAGLEEQVQAARLSIARKDEVLTQVQTLFARMPALTNELNAIKHDVDAALQAKPQ